MTRLNLSDIRTDGGTQMRAKLDDDVITEYAENYPEKGCKMPPVVVFYDGEAHWLADGFHRVAAAKKAGRSRIAADIRGGTRRDAVLHACGANAEHSWRNGLPRTKADKRRAVETILRDEEWSQKYSDGVIAKTCNVSRSLVYTARSQLVLKTGSREPRKRTGLDGKERPATQPKRQPAAEQEPADPAQEAPGGEVIALRPDAAGLPESDGAPPHDPPEDEDGDGDAGSGADAEEQDPEMVLIAFREWFAGQMHSWKGTPEMFVACVEGCARRARRYFKLDDEETEERLG